MSCNDVAWRDAVARREFQSLSGFLMSCNRAHPPPVPGAARFNPYRVF